MYRVVGASLGVLAAAVATFAIYATVVWSPPDGFYWGDQLMRVQPATYAALGIAMAFSLSVLGAGWYVQVSHAQCVAETLTRPLICLQGA